MEIDLELYSESNNKKYDKMNRLAGFLETEWKIKKKTDNKYRLKRNKEKQQIDLNMNNDSTYGRLYDDKQKQNQIFPLGFKKQFMLMIFLYNTLETGWEIRKKDKNYIFTKKHNNDATFMNDKYVCLFLSTNLLSKSK